MGKLRPKGSGAGYARKIKRLGEIHLKILEILVKIGRPITKQAITKNLNETSKRESQRLVGGFSISGRLSELCGLKLVAMKYGEVELLDPLTMTFRHQKKPLWKITEKGLEVLKTGKLHARR